MHEDHPTKLSVSIGSWGGFSRDVTLAEDGTVVYEKHGVAHLLEERHEVRPSKRAWSRFLGELDRLGVWDWRRDYFDPDVCDGTQWEVEIRHGEHVIKTFGSNCYPSADGSPSRNPTPTECFDQFCQAVSKLSGGRKFK
jgi:hypothetical protein